MAPMSEPDRTMPDQILTQTGQQLLCGEEAAV
jgi:hypothetical protein